MAVDKGVRCRRCRGTTQVIVGDGPPVCYGCVLMLGHIVKEPAWGSDKILAALDELHADVVTLVREDNVLSWEWTATWPVTR